MNADNIATLKQVSIEVLERYAFMLADPHRAEDEPLVWPASLWRVTISFVGPSRGALGLLTSPELTRQVAANLNGAEVSEINEEQAQDAIKEFLNIVCGDYLHSLVGNGAIFDLAAPVAENLPREQALEKIRDKPQAAFTVEGQALLMFIES